MRYVSFKPGVKFNQFTPALGWILHCCNVVQNRYDWVPDIVITSVNDSAHKIGSRHYTDEAVDIRSKNFKNLQDKLMFVDILSVLLNEDPEALTLNRFTVLFENRDTENEHFHVQVTKDKTYP